MGLCRSQDDILYGSRTGEQFIEGRGEPTDGAWVHMIRGGDQQKHGRKWVKPSSMEKAAEGKG